jgi:signal peptidase I
MYNGRVARALWTFVGVQLWAVALISLTFVVPGAAARVLLLVLVLVSSWTFCGWDAVRTARRAPAAQRRTYQRWYALLGIALCVALIVQPWNVRFIKQHIAEAFEIPTGSMEPTLLIGDYVLVSKSVHRPIHRGDVLIYAARDGRARFIQRVVGLPGDTLAMRDYGLAVNGRSVSEPYVSITDSADVTTDELGWQREFLAPGVDRQRYQPSVGNWGPLVIPADRYFLLGDHRDASYDSRYRGLIAGEQLVGRPEWVYFSREPAAGIRWRRLGRAIR